MAPAIGLPNAPANHQCADTDMDRRQQGKLTVLMRVLMLSMCRTATECRQ